MKPRLVLHICCAPDQAWVLQSLQQSHELLCFFSNSNVHPEAEYRMRMEESRQVARSFGVGFEAAEYRPDLWERATADVQHTPEGGERCRLCFRQRLEDTARFCSNHGWPAFTTVMSISPHKRVEVLNQEGTRVAAQYGVVYEPFDFKKKGGFQESIKLSKHMGLYRQDYCGCRLSLAERDSRAAGRAAKA